MRKIWLVMIFVMFLFPVSGCASLKSLTLGLFHFKVADKTQVAENMTGVGKMNNKVADKAAVVDNSKKEEINNTAGGNIFTQATNDPVVILSISGSLFSFMGAIMVNMFLTLRAKDKQIAKIVENQQKFIGQQEEGQQKYIKLLEDIAMSVINGKLKGGI